MLTPEYYNYCADDIVELYTRLDESIIRDITRRLVKEGKVTEGARWQIEVERSAGLLYDDIISKVAEYSDSSQAAVKAIFEDAGITSKDFDDEIYKSAGKQPIPLKLSPAMLQVLTAGIAKTNGAIANLTKTTALTSQSTFIEACALAEMEITSGAFDYNTAIRHAVDHAVSQGTTVEYASGVRTNIEAAVRRAVMTGVSQTTGEISLANARELDTNLMEITAHGGARPEHAVWQGQIVCIAGKKRGYLSLSDIGYGEVTGFKGINCRHDWFPFIEGISTRAYTKKQLQDLENQTVIYDGEEIPQYEAEQMQRKMERQIRNDKRMLAGYDEAIKSADDEKLKSKLQEDFDFRALKLKEHEKKYKDFCKQTTLPSLNERLQSRGFNRSVSQKAVHSAKDLKKRQEFVIIKQKEIANDIKNGKYNKSLNIGNQNKHLVSSHSYNESEKKSILYGDLKTAQDLIDKYAGTGEIKINKKGEWIKKEFVSVDYDIGEVWNGEEYKPTNRFSIHYGKNGTHVVPAERKKYGTK